MNMRATAVLLLALSGPSIALAQTSPPPPTTPQTPPATPAPKRPRATQSTATAVLTATVTDASGAPLEGVTVSIVGPVEREAVTTSAGQARMMGVRAGTYRVRFEKTGFYTFEKEVTWRAGTPAPSTEATLNAAPPPPPPPEPPKAEEPPRPAVPDYPPGKPTTMDVPDYIDRNHITNREPQKESLIGCSGGAQVWLWQVREPWQKRSHEDADLILYVVGGEGTLNMDGRDSTLAAGTMAVVPRGTMYSVARRGRAQATYLLATLSGPPCAQ